MPNYNRNPTDPIKIGFSVYPLFHWSNFIFTASDWMLANPVSTCAIPKIIKSEEKRPHVVLPKGYNFKTKFHEKRTLMPGNNSKKKKKRERRKSRTLTDTSEEKMEEQKLLLESTSSLSTLELFEQESPKVMPAEFAIVPAGTIPEKETDSKKEPRKTPKKKTDDDIDTKRSPVGESGGRVR